jgi:hypothetical protein
MKRYEHTAEAFWQFLAKKMKLNLSFYIAFLSGIGVSKRLKFDEDKSSKNFKMITKLKVTWYLFLIQILHKNPLRILR